MTGFNVEVHQMDILLFTYFLYNLIYAMMQYWYTDQHCQCVLKHHSWQHPSIHEKIKQLNIIVE